MLIRLMLFAALLLILPWLGQALGGATEIVEETGFRPPFPVFAALVAVALLAVAGGKQHTLFRLQPRYALVLSGAGAGSGWLLASLNRYADSWYIPGTVNLLGGLVLTLLFALLPVAVLEVRARLARIPGLLQRLARLPPLPGLDATQASAVLIPLSLLGLIGGAAWPASLAGLLWSAPLWLLLTLQVLWHERTIFAEAVAGNWGRLLCAAAAGLLVGNLAMLAFDLAGGELLLHVSQPAVQGGYALYGLFVLQLGDILAEPWHGKPRSALFKGKPFPIRVISKKVP